MTSLTVVFMSFNCFQGFSGRLETSLSSRSVISDLACSSCSVVIWVNFTHCCKEKYSVITHLCNSGTYLFIHIFLMRHAPDLGPMQPLCKTDNKLSLFRCFIHSPYWYLYISKGVEKENMFDNQELFKSAIISYILKTFTFDSRVTQWGEIRDQKSQGLKVSCSMVVSILSFSGSSWYFSFLIFLCDLFGVGSIANVFHPNGFFCTRTFFSKCLRSKFYTQ